MKKLLSFVLAGVLMLSAAGCAAGGTAASSQPSSDAAAPSSAESADPSAVQIGVLIPGSPTDGGFCQQGAEAGDALKALGYDVSVVEAVTAEEVKAEAEAMASEGYKIVFGHGAQTVSPLAEISPDYPDTWFVTLGGEVVTDNQFPICVCAEESTYVLGVIAGMMTKSGIIAYTVGGDYPSYTKYTNAFQLGAESVNPDVQTLGAVLSATTPTEGYETTKNQIASGADMILSNSNEGQIGAIKAVQESEDAFAFGNLGDFNDTAPDKIIANLICDYSVGYIQATEQIMDGTIQPEIMFMTISNGCVDVLWNDAMKATLPEEVIQAADTAYEGVKSGAIDVPNEYELGPDYTVGG